MSDRDILFNEGTDTGDGGLYHRWSADAVPTVKERTIFYDSNVAFTDGTASISTAGTKTVPNLYDTLKGLNQRINDIQDNSSSSGGTSIAGITTEINNNNVTMKAENNSTNLSLTIDATAISFKFNDGAVYSMEDIFKMLEELRARTHSIKTNVTRVDIANNYINGNAANDPNLWTENTITDADEQL